MVENKFKIEEGCFDFFKSMDYYFSDNSFTRFMCSLYDENKLLDKTIRDLHITFLIDINSSDLINGRTMFHFNYPEIVTKSFEHE